MLGTPSWVFWGVLVPWVAADVFAVWFCFCFMADDPLADADISLKTDFKSNNVETVVLADVKNESPNPIRRAEFWICPGGANDPNFAAKVKHVDLLEGTKRRPLEFSTRDVMDDWRSFVVAFPKPVAPGQRASLRFEYTMTGKQDHSSAPIVQSEEPRSGHRSGRDL